MQAFREHSPTELAHGRKLVGFGAGVAFVGTQRTSPLPVRYLVDENTALHGQRLLDVPIHAPEQLREDGPDGAFVVLYGYSGPSVLGMSRRLASMGFRFGRDFTDCSYLHAGSIAARLEHSLGWAPSRERFHLVRMLALMTTAKNLSTVAGTWLFVELVERLVPALGGEVAELGVYTGGNALSSLLASATLRATPYHLFDSFEGFPELSAHDPASWRGDFADIDFPAFQAMFEPFANVRIHRGFFSETLAKLPPASFAVAYSDADLYDSTRQALDALLPRMPSGAGLLLHDYWVPDAPLPGGARDVFGGARRAVDEVLGSRRDDLVVLPETTHALLIV